MDSQRGKAAPPLDVDGEAGLAGVELDHCHLVDRPELVRVSYKSI
ncbi:MAG TPA: hypothetical protein VM451_10070 [Candidatus Limnocylindria bacterium]|nr:hypothetical protein [Candidatus Limnocylindria bacterium]